MRKYFIPLWTILFIISATLVFAENQWTSLKQFERSKDLGHPAACIDEQGNAFALWANKELKGIYASVFDNTTKEWGEVTRLSEVIEVIDSKSYVKFPKVQVDKAGNALALWQTDEGIRCASYDGTTKQWSPSSALTKVRCSRMSFAMSSKGDAIAAWYDSSINRIQVSCYDNETKQWSESTIIGGYALKATNGQNKDLIPLNIKVCIDDNSDGFVVWNQTDAKLIVAFKNAWGSSLEIGYVYHDPARKESKLDCASFDAYIDVDMNSVFVWSEKSWLWGINTYSRKWDRNLLAWNGSAQFIHSGCYPKMKVNSQGQVVGCFSGAKDKKLTCAVLNPQTQSFDDVITSPDGFLDSHYEATSALSDIAITKTGEVFVTWSLYSGLLVRQNMTHFKIASSNVLPFHQKKTTGIWNEGRSVIAVNSAGQAVLVFDDSCFCPSDPKYGVSANVYTESMDRVSK